MKENVYFDNASTSWPKPEAVYRAIDRFQRDNGVNPGRGGHAMAVEAERLALETRRMLAAFFGFAGDARRVIFTLNGTDSLNTVLGGLMQPGDHLVTTRLEHNAVLRPANHGERDHGLRVTRVQVGDAGHVDPEAIAAAVGPDTRAIVISHASNVLGTVQPVARIGQIARQAGIPLVLDAAQSAGVLPIDMHTWGVAALACPGHKGLFGPMGIGVLVVDDTLQLRPTRVGGTGVDSLSDFQPDAYPWHLEAGSVPMPGIAGLHAAQRWFAELGERCVEQADEPIERDHGAWCRIALAHIHKVEMAHVERLVQHLQRLPRARLMVPLAAGPRVPIVSFTVEGLPASQVADMLDADHHVCVRAGLHCAPLVHVDAHTVEQDGAVRLSPGYFTDEEDMLRLLAALDDALG